MFHVVYCDCLGYWKMEEFDNREKLLEFIEDNFENIKKIVEGKELKVDLELKELEDG